MVVDDREFGKLLGLFEAMDREVRLIRGSVDKIDIRLGALEIDSAVARSRRSEICAIAAILVSVAALVCAVGKLFLGGA